MRVTFRLWQSKTGEKALPAKEDVHSQAERAKKAFAHLAGGKQPPPEVRRRPLSAVERETVEKVVEELTGKRPRASLENTQAEINRRLSQMFGGQMRQMPGGRPVDQGAESAPVAGPGRPPWGGSFPRR